jgi:uncharacterized protein YqhQ
MTLALSHKNGIDFFVKKRKTIIHMTKKPDGKIEMEKFSNPFKVRRIEFGNPLKLIMIVFILLLPKLFMDLKGNSLIIFGLVCLWVFNTLSAYLDYIYPPLKARAKFHAAEHKAFNYLEKFRKPPTSIEELAKMPSIAKECGTSTRVMNLALISLFAFGIMYIPTTPFKVLWCLISLLVVYYLWDTDKLNFIQKMTIAEPSESELELAMIGITEYWKLKEGVDYKSEHPELDH